MQETEAFRKYQRAAVVLDAVSKVIAIAAFLTVMASSVLGIVLFEKINPKTCFVIAVAASGTFAFVAVPLIFVSQQKKNAVKLCRSYLKVLGRNPKNAVEEIHEALGTAFEKIVEDFVKFKKMGFIDELFIDSESNVVNSGLNNEREFDCPVCGGKTVIKQGEEDVCGFCGAIKEKEKI